MRNAKCPTESELITYARLTSRAAHLCQNWYNFMDISANMRNLPPIGAIYVDRLPRCFFFRQKFLDKIIAATQDAYIPGRNLIRARSIRYGEAEESQACHRDEYTCRDNTTSFSKILY